jgi:hypothetical protein
MSERMTKRERRDAEIDELIFQVKDNLDHIAKRVEDIPYEMNLGAIKAIRNTVARARLDVDGFIDRDNARREAR